MYSATTPFQLVTEMNEAFGNPAGDFTNVNLKIIRAEVKSIFDEYAEALEALGFDGDALDRLKEAHAFAMEHYKFDDAKVDMDQVRDALADIQVFSMGAQHKMGVNGDADVTAVVEGVMTRFIKDDADKAASTRYHASRGVSDVYFEGEYPKMVMKSGSDQPDAPKGKFLKSASYSLPKMPDPVMVKTMLKNGYSFTDAVGYAQGKLYFLAHEGWVMRFPEA